MQVTARLKNLRISPRKVRIVASLIKGLTVKEAKAQLQFTPKKSAFVLLKLLNSAIGNARHNFNLEEENLFVTKLTVDGGSSLKRWMPRAMGRATPILKRTSHVSLILEEKTPSKQPATRLRKEVRKERQLAAEAPVEKEEKISVIPEAEELKVRPTVITKPYGASPQAKKRFFSRQTFGNIKKVFRRKAV